MSMPVTESRNTPGSITRSMRTRAGEDEIFDQWGLGKSPQQAETENPPPGGIFCLSLSYIGKHFLQKREYTEIEPKKLSNERILFLRLVWNVI